MRLLEEIRAAGYTGGYSQLKALVRQLRPAPPPEPVVRFETPAGHQAQVDFAEFRFPWGKRYALARRARLLAVAVVSLLSAPGHAHADRPASRTRFWRSAACRRSCSSIR